MDGQADGFYMNRKIYIDEQTDNIYIDRRIYSDRQTYRFRWTDRQIYTTDRII